jgi:hypothetical protein
MSQSEYEAFGVDEVRPKHLSKSHISYREDNQSSLEPCFVCGSDAIQGWSFLGSFIMCSRDGCLNQFHSTSEKTQFELADCWNSIDRSTDG